jgi:hypothetical protein
MATRFKTCRDQQAKLAEKQSGEAAAPAPRKRTKAEAVANSIGVMVNKLRTRCSSRAAATTSEERRSTPTRAT